MVTPARPSKRDTHQLLALARAAIERVTPEQAAQHQREGALIVDIRPEQQRATHGEIPGALIIERNVLEWRFDPTGEWHHAQVSGYDRFIIVLCQEGYASSLAAASLQALGHERVADVIGGHQAWKTAGLPAAPR